MSNHEVPTNQAAWIDGYEIRDAQTGRLQFTSSDFSEVHDCYDNWTEGMDTDHARQTYTFQKVWNTGVVERIY